MRRAFKSICLIALACGSLAAQSLIDFRIAGGYFRDADGVLIPDQSVLFQLVYLGSNGVFDPIPSGEWVGGDDVVVNLPFSGDYASAAATDIDQTGNFADGIFSRRYTLTATSGVAQSGGAFGLRWFPSLSPADYPGSVPLAGEAFGEVSDFDGETPWVFPAAGALTTNFTVFDPSAAADFGETVTSGFTGFPDASVEAGVWAERERLTNDTRLSDQTNLLDLGAAIAWEHTGGSFEPVVAVIDSGIESSHADLAASIWTNSLEINGNGFDDDGNGYVDDINGWDFLDDDNNPDDLTGHGTHLSGLIGAVRDNSFGIAGIAKRVRILPLKVGNSLYSEAAVIEALDYVVALKNRGVPIVAVNNSYVFESSTAPSVDTPLKQAVERVCDAGILFVSSAGNKSRNLDSDGSPGQSTYLYPANYDFDELIVVGGTNNSGGLYTQSNTGQVVDLFAPAESVLSTEIGGSFSRRSGTSQAAALVSGAIALFSEAAGHVDADRIAAALTVTLDENSALVGFGAGEGTLSLRRLAYYVGVDSWLAQNYGANFVDLPAADLSVDSDGNGLSNILEFALGLAPGDSPTSIQMAVDGSSLSLNWELDPSVRAFDWVLQSRDDLSSGNWAGILESELLFLGNSQDDARVRLQYTVPNIDETSHQFFRIQVAPAVD
ncbi:MAG: S8 family serine peptidase [Opitutaceae bacterium]